MESDLPHRIRGFTYERLLGSGTYGQVFLYSKGSEKVAIKLENANQNFQTLTSETITLKKIIQATPYPCENTRQEKLLVPKYYDHGLVNSDKDNNIQYNFLTMEYLDQSLDEYLSSNADNRNALSFGQISVLALKALKSLHQRGFIHKDVKPDNFRIKDNEVYLIDFGLSREYMTTYGKHIPFSVNK